MHTYFTWISGHFGEDQIETVQLYRLDAGLVKGLRSKFIV